MMNNEKVNDQLKDIIIKGSGMLGAYLLKKTTALVYKKGFGREVPSRPGKCETTWRDALVYAALTGAAAGMLKLVIRYGTDKGLKMIS